jgi:hypothetical protein
LRGFGCVESSREQLCFRHKDRSRNLVTLVELLEICAEPYWRLGGLLGQLICRLQAVEAGLAPNPSYVSGHLGGTLGEMERELSRLGLKSPLKHLKRIFDSYATGSELNWEKLKDQLIELHQRVMDELGDQTFLFLPSEVLGLYRQNDSLFGTAVEKTFSEMTEDISEAGKCLALNRPTACVFHLMRVMERGVQRLGTKLGIQQVEIRVWQGILDQINPAIKKLDPKKTPLAVVYAEAASHLYNVKVAWRNEVMHPKQTYTFEEADAIFRSVKTFIRDLADIVGEANQTVEPGDQDEQAIRGVQPLQ